METMNQNYKNNLPKALVQHQLYPNQGGIPTKQRLNRQKRVSSVANRLAVDNIFPLASAMLLMPTKCGHKLKAY